MAQGLLYPALPLYLTRELGTSKAVAGLVVSLIALTSIAIRPWAGGFIDRVGRRPLLIAGPILAALSAVGLLTMKMVVAVMVMRLLQGAGSALTYSSAVAIVADVAPPHKRAGYLALFSTFFYVGFALGPFIAELLIRSSGFQAVWWTVGGCTAFGAAVATLVRETRPATLSAPPKVPLLHRLFHPSARLPGMVFFSIGIGWTAVASFLSLYARDIGLSNSDVLFLALSVSVLATRFLSGGLADRFGRLAVAVPSIVLVVAGLAGLALFDTPRGRGDLAGHLRRRVLRWVPGAADHGGRSGAGTGAWRGHGVLQRVFRHRRAARRLRGGPTHRLGRVSARLWSLRDRRRSRSPVPAGDALIEPDPRFLRRLMMTWFAAARLPQPGEGASPWPPSPTTKIVDTVGQSAARPASRRFAITVLG